MSTPIGTKEVAALTGMSVYAARRRMRKIMKRCRTLSNGCLKIVWVRNRRLWMYPESLSKLEIDER